MERTFKMGLALLLILILAVVLTSSVLPYLNFFFGAFILFVIFRPLYEFLHMKLKIRRNVAALSVIVISIILVLIPLYYLLSVIVSEAQLLLTDQQSISIIVSKVVDQINPVLHNIFLRYNLDQVTIESNLKQKILELASDVVNFVSMFVLGSIQGISRQLIGLTIMYFLLYYLFVDMDSDFFQKLSAAVPFNQENTEILLTEFKNVVRTTLVASGIIALVQGGILTIAFLIFGIQGAFLWGSIAAILSFLPLVGATFVWAPAALIQLLQQNYIAGAGIFAAGIIISTVDNFIRPFIQKKLGSMHPFASLLGIIIGVSLFGLIGIVIGPLLLSYFLLTVKMFIEEYISEKS